MVYHLTKDRKRLLKCFWVRLNVKRSLTAHLELRSHRHKSSVRAGYSTTRTQIRDRRWDPLPHLRRGKIRKSVGMVHGFTSLKYRWPMHNHESSRPKCFNCTTVSDTALATRSDTFINCFYSDPIVSDWMKASTIHLSNLLCIVRRWLDLRSVLSTGPAVLLLSYNCLVSFAVSALILFAELETLAPVTRAP